MNDIYFAEQGSDELIPFTVSINVKEKVNGNFFYSFSAEKTEGTPTRRTLHADVNDGDNAIANGSSSNASIRNPNENVNKIFSNRDSVGNQLSEEQQEAVTQALEKENAKLRKDVAELRELVSLQRQVTNGTKFTKTSVEAAAISLKQSANAKGDTKGFAKLLNGLYEYIASAKELTWEGAIISTSGNNVFPEVFTYGTI